MRKNQLISSSEFEKRLALRDAAQANLHALDIAVQEAQSSVAQADAQLRQAHAILADLQIKAPQAGRVVYKLVEVGNVIAAGQKSLAYWILMKPVCTCFFQPLSSIKFPYKVKHVLYLTVSRLFSLPPLAMYQVMLNLRLNLLKPRQNGKN